jgi:hypothetical protein
MTLPSPAAPPPAKQTRFLKWHRRVLAFCLIVFAFELGLFLLVFPWLKSWEMSWIPVHSPHFAKLWMSRYFRGAISGLGLLNIYIALVEAVKQLKSIFGEQRS